MFGMKSLVRMSIFITIGQFEKSSCKSLHVGGANNVQSIATVSSLARGVFFVSLNLIVN